MNDMDPRQALLQLLQGAPSDALHYPYTETFDLIYDQLKTTGFPGDKHALWELILQLQEAPVANDNPGAPQLSARDAEITRDAKLHDPWDSQVPALPQGLEAQTLFDAVVQPQRRPVWQPPLPDALAKKRQQLLAQVSAGQFGTRVPR